MVVMGVEMRDVGSTSELWAVQREPDHRFDPPLRELTAVASDLESIVADIEGGSFLDEPHRLSVQAIAIRNAIEALHRLSTAEEAPPSTDYFLG